MPPPSSLLDDIRRGCALVMERARFVKIDEGRLAELARELASGPAQATPQLDPAHHYVGDAATTLAYVVTLDAVNFGSGWFPHLRKRPGCSGYFTLSTALKEHFEARGPWSAESLQALEARDCAEVFRQDLAVPEVVELMALFARSLGDLGAFLERRCGGRFEGLIDLAAGSAERLALLLGEMPLYRDVSPYEELEVPFYKRAQITAADLALAFDGRGAGAVGDGEDKRATGASGPACLGENTHVTFGDVDRLTVFADNLVPHVLRCEGVLAYAPELAARIDAGELIAHDCPEEVEIRAAAVDVVERMTRLLAAAEAGGAGPLAARELDNLLWNRGQHPATKAHPRHRTRTTAY